MSAIVRPANIPHFRPKVRSTARGRRYEQYIASPQWVAKKDDYWSTYGRHCQAPGCDDIENLHVHHHTYVRLGSELLTDLVGLCEGHHEEVHAIHRANKGLSLTRATEVVIDRKLSSGKRRATRSDMCPNCKTLVSGPVVYRKVKGKTVRVKLDCTMCSADQVVDERPRAGSRGVWRRNAGRCGGCSTTEMRPGTEVAYVRVNRPPTRRYAWVATSCPFCKSLVA